MADLSNGISSVGSLSLVDKDTGISHSIQAAKDITFSPGITQEIVYATTELGIEQAVKIRTTREDPEIQITFPRKTLTAIGFATGRKWEKVALSDCLWVRTFVPQKLEYPAKTTGFEGFGVALDPANVIGSVQIDPVSESITRVAYGTAGTPLVGTKSFAIGANGALKFTPDLLGNPVSLEVPYTLTNIYELGESYFKRLRLCATLLMDDNKLVQIQFLEASPVLDGNSLNFNDTGLQAKFKSILTGEACVGYQMRYLGLGRKC